MSENQKKKRAKAGHPEVHGETIAKFEFFDNGYNPYSRYLDEDKVDLILRKVEGDIIKYIDVQVKYGRLFECGKKWEQKNFDLTSWRFFLEDEFSKLTNPNLLIAYVLVNPTLGYQGDIFIFKATEFHRLINSGIKTSTKKGIQYKMHIAHCKKDLKWYVWKKQGFEDLNSDTVIEVTNYRRNFKIY